MQKRTLNFRSYYDINQENYAINPQNITANFYPVNSAIAIRDGARQFTVSNDRAQGGSSLYQGEIEFFQNRRIGADDHRGVEEFLNETDQYGNGIRVPATYYLQLGSRKSTQRLVQIVNSEPLQFMFANSLSNTGNKPEGQLKSGNGDSSSMKTIVQPLARNKVMVRFENL